MADEQFTNPNASQSADKYYASNTPDALASGAPNRTDAINPNRFVRGRNRYNRSGGRSSTYMKGAPALELCEESQLEEITTQIVARYRSKHRDVRVIASTDALGSALYAYAMSFSEANPRLLTESQVERIQFLVLEEIVPDVEDESDSVEGATDAPEEATDAPEGVEPVVADTQSAELDVFAEMKAAAAQWVASHPAGISDEDLQAAIDALKSDNFVLYEWVLLDLVSAK